MNKRTATNTAVATATGVALASLLFLGSNGTNLNAERILVSFHDGTSGPSGWPAGTQRTESRATPDGWDTNMTLQAFRTYREERRTDWETWEANNPPPGKARFDNDVRDARGSELLRNALNAQNKRAFVNGLTVLEQQALQKEMLIRDLAHMSLLRNPRYR